MQIASRTALRTDPNRGVEIELEMTDATGLYVRFVFGSQQGLTPRFSWGDGSDCVIPYVPGNMTAEHTYAAPGRYTVTVWGVRSIGFRSLDGEAACAWDSAILSLVDHGGELTGSRSAGFKGCANIRRFVAPNVSGMGQSDFRGCSSLEEVVIGRCGTYFDCTFMNCIRLRRFVTRRSWTCWKYVWSGCSSLTELHLGDVNQLATGVFDATPSLMDIWIANKTVAQIMQRAESGNIVGGYGAKFPWGARSDCRFHGTDGIVTGDGTIVA